MIPVIASCLVLTAFLVFIAGAAFLSDYWKLRFDLLKKYWACSRSIMLLAGLLLVLGSCKRHRIDHAERAIYYWKSTSYFSDQEKQICDTLGIKKIYIKFFEVNFSGERGSFPEAKTDWWGRYQELASPTELVPTVYLRNIVFQKSSKTELDMLADNVNFLINRLLTERFSTATTVREFQMDCDWTISSRDNYFYFLEKLKTLSGKKISCTLRLYPYKYRDKMGIPPVDKVTLMCYNLLNPLENPRKNSILDPAELESYLKGQAKYPKHLDIVLPVYSWAQVYHNERFYGLIHQNVQPLIKMMKPLKPFWYRVLRDTMFNSVYLRTGDEIKYEDVSASKLKESIAILKKHLDFGENVTVALFHLDEEQLKNYSRAELSYFYTDFSN